MERLTEREIHILRENLCGMKRRCYKPQDKSYKDYGGRGISVCDEWMDKKHGHKNFQEWAIANGWKKGLSIDRIDNNGNYSPDNCRWATPKQQSNNTRFNRLVTINGETKTLSEWADFVGISQRAMTGRIEAGWSEEDLLKPRYRPLKMTKAQMSKEIREWRTLEEQGLLLKLPCKVGDTVWINTNPANVTAELDDFGKPVETYECYVRAFSVWNGYIQIHITCKNPKRNVGSYITEEDFGKTVFLTQAEAEKALKGMERED